MPQDDDRRQEIRLPYPIQLRFNILDSREAFLRDQTSSLAGTVMDDSAPTLEGRDEVERFLNHLDKKINLILAVLMDNIARKDYQYQAQLLDISESGVRLVSPIGLTVGTVIEMGITLPNQPYRTMDVAGEVVWQNDSDQSDTKLPRGLVGIHFTDILASDQDLIVHYIFQKQREEIRRLKG